MAITLDLQIASEADDLPTEEQFQTWVETALSGHDNHELTVRLVNSEESQQLNQQFRGKDKPTNVLAFPFDNEGISLDIPLLGDLVICAPVVASEAEQQQKPLAAHWAHLVIHGCLHLLGYDHQTDEQAEVMEAQEIEFLQQLGYDNPYV